VTAIGRVATAVARLQAQPLPARLAPPVTDMLDRLAPVMSPTLRLAVANRWLFGLLVERRMTSAVTTNALVRTTTAPTIFRAGIKDNVLPVEAEATVNFRILPGDSVASVTAQVRRIIDDPEVELAPYDFSSEPSPVSSVDTPAFVAIERASREVFPEAVVAPGLVIGATDNRHYGAVREARYNYMPVTLTEPDLHRVHGANERIGVEDYARLVQFYVQLFRGTAG
jgi:carboxypeptidase PM20D1